jgi:hypothetical protein
MVTRSIWCECSYAKSLMRVCVCVCVCAYAYIYSINIPVILMWLLTRAWAEGTVKSKATTPHRKTVWWMWWKRLWHAVCQHFLGEAKEASKYQTTKSLGSRYRCRNLPNTKQKYHLLHSIIHSFISQWFYNHFYGPWQLFRFLNPINSLGRGMRQSQNHYLHTGLTQAE